MKTVKVKVNNEWIDAIDANMASQITGYKTQYIFMLSWMKKIRSVKINKRVYFILEDVKKFKKKIGS